MTLSRGRSTRIVGGSAVTCTKAGSALPMITSTLPEPEPPPGDAVGVVEGDGDGDGLGAGASAGPPDTHTTWAVPERVSEMRFSRATPSFVLLCSSMRPSVVKHWRMTPSAAGVPAGSMTSAEMIDTPPLEGMKGGFANRVTVEPGGAVRIAWWQVAFHRARPASTRVPSRLAGASALNESASRLSIDPPFLM